jgi:hypothetical protein
MDKVIQNNHKLQVEAHTAVGQREELEIKFSQIQAELVATRGHMAH